MVEINLAVAIRDEPAISGFVPLPAPLLALFGITLVGPRDLLRELFRGFLADVLFQSFGRRCDVFALHHVTVVHRHHLATAPVVVNLVDVLAQVVALGRLLAADERHTVVALVHGHLRDALDGERRPRVGLADEGGVG